VVLDSIVTHASRPIRAFVLCREHTQADFERMAVLFPTVSFVWLPTDGVDYGSLRGLLTYTTVATMDRLLLPELLPEVTRIIHHDLDALCLTDLAKLFDVELGGTPIAGCRQPQLKTISGFAGFMRKSEKFTGNPQRGREFLRLSHARHTFDFEILNAGIMLLDLAVMRADKFCEEFLPYVERFGMNDQGVINAYVGGNRVEVDRGWNWRPWLGTIPEPKIAHWAGPFKPWHKNWVYGRDLWRAAEARVADRYQQAGL
jgi:lipopolysaccharide biosynthesis glycosyltransferase